MDTKLINHRTKYLSVLLNHRYHHVVGVGYGDEGKGSITSKIAYQLLKNSRNTVANVRYGGGHQVGHTTFDGKNYIEHHNVGSAIHPYLYLRSKKHITNKFEIFYSRNTTINIHKLHEEVEYLKRLFNYHENRLIQISDQAPLVTPFDIHANVIDNIISGHGSTGMGFGKTIERTINGLVFDARTIMDAVDIEIQSILNEIGDYYHYLNDDERNNIIKEYIESLNINNFEVTDDEDYRNNFKLTSAEYLYLIYEGHQGALLDMNSDDFPHVTRSKTTFANTSHSKIIDCTTDEELFNKLISYPKVTNRTLAYLYYINNFLTHAVTRIYSTRHGNGPFINNPIKLVNNENESNHFNINQGEFRTAKLNLKDLERGLSYIIKDYPKTFYKYVDDINSLKDLKPNIILHITCCDQVDSDYFKETYSKISELNIIKENNIVLKTHWTNDFRYWNKNDKIDN